MSSARLTIMVIDPGMLVRVGKIECLLDAQSVSELKFGEAKTVSCSPGEHEIQVVLHAAIKRKSKPLRVRVAESEMIGLTCKYSWLWGNLKLSLD